VGVSLSSSLGAFFGRGLRQQKTLVSKMNVYGGRGGFTHASSLAARAYVFWESSLAARRKRLFSKMNEIGGRGG